MFGRHLQGKSRWVDIGIVVVWGSLARIIETFYVSIVEKVNIFSMNLIYYIYYNMPHQI